MESGNKRSVPNQAFFNAADVIFQWGMSVLLKPFKNGFSENVFDFHFRKLQYWKANEETIFWNVLSHLSPFPLHKVELKIY